MKKLLAFILVATMLLSLFGCATEPQETDPPATNPPATNPPATNPPATNPPETDPPATNPPEDDKSALINGELIVKEGEPNFAELDVMTWMQYEFNKDYSDIFSNALCYSHEDIRMLLDLHWGTYMQIIIPGLVSEEQAKELLKVWHNTRALLEPITDVEAARIYLWPEGKVPTITEYTENTGYMYADEPGFQPFMLESLVEEGTEIKGAVLVCTGGGHVFRSAVEEGYEVCKALNARGYQTFLVNYRVDPYSDVESALDIARAIRYVRAHAEEYGIKEDNIAVAGFSYGGIVASLQANDYYGDITAAAVVEGYVPDELDAVDASMNAYLAVYSIAAEEIHNTNFPATFFALGADDGVTGWCYSTYEVLRAAGIRTEMHIFAGVPHGIGAGIHADGTLYENVAAWPMLADCFMQDVYLKADQAEAPAE